MPVIFEPMNGVLTAAASVFAAVKFDRTRSGDDRFLLLPNIKVETLHFQEGIVPSGQFSYVLDDTDPSSTYPITISELFPTAASGPYVLRQDDEILVFEFTDSGDRYLVFDGFVQLPQVDVAPNSLHAHFVATGVHTRLWDQPVGGATYRDAEDPQAGAAVKTGLPTWFNPGGKPSCTPVNWDLYQGSPNARPLFLDEGLPAVPGASPVAPRPWTLEGFVRYLCWSMNAPEEFVKNPVSPTGADLSDYLKSVTPAAGDYMDLSNPSTYVTSDITIRSYDATNRNWVDTVKEQLGYYGFHLYMNTREDPADPGAPLNEIVIYRTDGRDGNRPKELYYPPHGGLITDGVPSFHGFSVTRDAFYAANEFEVECAPTEYECSLILAALFSVSASDATDSNIKNFNLSKMSQASAAVRAAYRDYGFDEAGLGHWTFASGGSFVTGTPTSLDSVLGGPDANGVRVYAHRLRKCKNTLLNVDATGKPRKAELAISRAYAGACPAVWDGTATDWVSVGDRGWGLLSDRIGVHLFGDNPQHWNIPDTKSTAFPGTAVKLITSLAAPTSENALVYFRLTCVIEGDFGASAVAPRRAATPMKYAVRRRIESKDHWKVQVADKSSVYNNNGAGPTIVVRDDRPAALAQAQSLRSAHEFPAMAGSVTVPWISHAVGVGDFISKINGQDVNLDRGAGGPAGESPHYPVVVGFSYNCQHPQSTTLKLHDRRSEPQAINQGFGNRRRFSSARG